MTIDYTESQPADDSIAFPIYSYGSSPLLGPIPGTPPSSVGREVIQLTGNASTGNQIRGNLDDSQAGSCGGCCN